jgi:hypothetical protein
MTSESESVSDVRDVLKNGRLHPHTHEEIKTMETTHTSTVFDLMRIPRNVHEDGHPTCHGQADATQDKCSRCVFIDTCLEEQALRHAATKHVRDTRGSDTFGFLNDSVKSVFAHYVARHPGCTMRDVKDASWNDKRNTFYDAFNELRRRDVPIAAKDARGRMMILRSRLSDAENKHIDAMIEVYGSTLD